MLIGDEVNIWPQKIAVQSCKHFILVLFGVMLFFFLNMEFFFVFWVFAFFLLFFFFFYVFFLKNIRKIRLSTLL